MKKKKKETGQEKDEKRKTVRDGRRKRGGKEGKGQEEEKRKRVTEGTRAPGKKQGFEPAGLQTNVSFLVLEIKKDDIVTNYCRTINSRQKEE